MSTSALRGTRRLRVLATVSGAAALASLAAVVPSIADSQANRSVVVADAAGAVSSAWVAPTVRNAPTSSPLSDRTLIAASADDVTNAPEPEAVAAQAAAPAVAPEPARLVWDQVADCESGSWTGDGGFVEASADWSSTEGFFEGGLQFHPDTWDAYRDTDMPSAAYDATREQQIVVAERVLAAQGWGAWPVCSRKLGLR